MYKIVNTMFLLILAIVLVLIKFFDYSFWLLINYGVAFLAITFAGSFFIQLNYFVIAYLKKETDEKIVALTFDDGPHENTPQILNLLDKYDMKASFFLIGKNIHNHKEHVNEMMQKGHSIGLHSFSHSFWFDFYRSDKVTEEVKKSIKALKDTTGKTSLLFRPPYGVTNPAIAKVVEKMHLKTIGWNIRTLDTMSKSKEAVLKRVQKKLQPGSVILLHDTVKNSPEILEAILQYLQREQYTSVTVESLFNIEAYVD